MFVNEDYLDYKYVVSCSDNYIILSNERFINGDYTSPDTVDVIYQYLSPSFLTIPDTYTSYSSRSFPKIEVDSNYWSRADSLWIFPVGFMILILIVMIINGFTRIIRPGGIF